MVSDEKSDRSCRSEEASARKPCALISSLPNPIVRILQLVRTDLATARRWIMPGVGTREEAEGGVALRGYVQDLDWMARYLSGLHWPFVIREPAALKDAMRRHAAALTAAAD